jgi:ATP-dependent RNA helicase DeaD
MEEQNSLEPKSPENGTDLFKALGLPEHILRCIEEKGFKKPTEIQEKSIPLVMEGKDVIAKASTGSGKTLAFGSVILRDTKKGYGIQALVLTPTRELAEQVKNELSEFSKHSHIKIISIYGGVSINEQIRELGRADIVVGTPGRILDHAKRNTIDLANLKTLVLDEADRMLDMGFITDVEKIISSCPKKRQTLLFSATMPKEIVHISKSHMNSPIEVSAGQYVDPTKLKQEYYEVEDKLKFALLKHLLENEKSELTMVFCNTRRKADLITKNLNFYNINSSAIHGGLSQDKRSNVMQKFQGQHIQVLVCTDIAARGLDIPKVTHIYNYDIPHDPKDYIHRIGRTARAGEEGKAISIVGPEHREDFDTILRNKKMDIRKQEAPALESIILQRRIRQESDERRGGRQDRPGRGGRDFRRGRGRREHRDNNKDWQFERKEGDTDHRPRREGGFKGREDRGSRFGRRNDRRGFRKEGYRGSLHERSGDDRPKEGYVSERVPGGEDNKSRGEGFNRETGRDRGYSRFGKREDHNHGRPRYGDRDRPRSRFGRGPRTGERGRAYKRDGEGYKGRREGEGYKGKRKPFIRRDIKRAGSSQNSFRRRERRY